MDKHSESKKIGALLATTALASGIIAFAPSVASPLIGKLTETVVGGIAVNFASGFLDRLKYSKLREWFVKPHPDDLNHDLQKTLQQAVLNAVDHIEVLYRSLLPNNKKNELASLVKLFKKQIDADFSKSQDEKVTRQELNTLLYEDAESAVALLMQILPGELTSFDHLHPPVPFSRFFKENILPQLQLSFGEILKDKDNERASTAFFRFITEEIKENTEQLLRQQEQMHRDIREIKNRKDRFPKLTNKQLTELRMLSKRLSEPITLQASLSQALDEYLGNVSSGIDIILEQQAKHYNLSEQIWKDTTQIKAQVAVLGDKLDKRFTRKEVVAISAGAVVLVGIIIGILYYFASQPFTAELILVPDKTQSIVTDYPALTHDAKISLLVQNKLTENIAFGGKVSFSNIKSRYKGIAVGIELQDELWQTASDSIILKRGINHVPIIPNERWAWLKGDIRYADGRIITESAELHLGNDTVFYSRGNGSFEIKLPIGMRKEMHDMNIYINGKHFVNEKVYPVGFIKIRKSE